MTAVVWGDCKCKAGFEVPFTVVLLAYLQAQKVELLWCDCDVTQESSWWAVCRVTSTKPKS